MPPPAKWPLSSPVGTIRSSIAAVPRSSTSGSDSASPRTPSTFGRSPVRSSCPLHVKRLAGTGRYSAAVAAGFVVDGGHLPPRVRGRGGHQWAHAGAARSGRPGHLRRAHAPSLPRARRPRVVLRGALRGQGSRGSPGVRGDDAVTGRRVETCCRLTDQHLTDPAGPALSERHPRPGAHALSSGIGHRSPEGRQSHPSGERAPYHGRGRLAIGRLVRRNRRSAMVALAIVLSAIVLLLAVLVAGLLRSHADILKALHDLGAGVGDPVGSAAWLGPLQWRRSAGSTDPHRTASSQ